ncbi:Ribosomal large subunit pseudouridine synthase B [Candidatus Hydrogenisulfobacillus filiaventi]|uniref:Pseudouridine synthase n=1 Tax=Candidatus Hydrogenisulfobacillus filiaventi TaxID=2707344 RepID=A0A6F8ZFQ6_9FIRM|nr:Ribosomal large subunit pseudouridine synthase B [Candidatus Hydrogenisulfobacillus filiaventi]
MRVQRYLAMAGLASRRTAEAWVAAGRVRVNGQPAFPGQPVDPARDRVEVDGQPVTVSPHRQYWLLHKPPGYTTTLADPHARRTIRALLPAGAGRLFPVGRLDRDTAGVLLLTDDGELAHRLMHPRFGVEKVYRLEVGRPLVPADLGRLRRPVAIGQGEQARVDRARLVASGPDRSVVEVTLHEGRKREVRRLARALGWPLVSLTRVRYAGLDLRGLPPGAVRRLTAEEVAHLRRLAFAADAQTHIKEGKEPHGHRA